MRNACIIFLLSILSVFQVSGQEINVNSFRVLENDMDAKIHHPKKDVNGNVAAIIKVVTIETGFSFDTGSLAVVATEQKVGEIWVYVQPKVRKITLRHPLLGVLRDYDFGGMSIKSATVYEMRITTSKIRTIVEEDAGGQYWVLKVEPSNAPVEVVIDERMTEILQNGVLQKLMPYGKHTYVIKSPFYEKTGGEFVIGREKIETSISLIPNCTYLDIVSVPENNADIFINGEKIGKTPLVIERSPESLIRLQAISPLHEAYEETIRTLGKGDTLHHSVNLVPNYSNISIVADADTDIYINDEKKCIGTWEGQLTEGLYKIEGVKEGYRKVLKTITVKRGADQVINLSKMSPVYGSLNISVGNLLDVQIYIDDVNVGIAPDVLSKVLIGHREVRLMKKGYKPFVANVLVEEGRNLVINAILEKEDVVSVDDKTLNYNEENIYTLDKENTQLSKRKQNIFTLYTFSPSFYYGGLLGFCQRFGWYAKAQLLISKNLKNVNYKYSLSELESLGNVQKGEKHLILVTSGPMFKLHNNLYGYAGLGFGEHGQFYWQDSNIYCPNRSRGLAAETGVALNIEFVTLSLGYSMILGKADYDAEKYKNFHIGIGVNF